MFKRIFLFLAMNMAVMIVIGIIITILENVFHINISWYGQSYVSIFIYALVVWFTWSFISLFLSKWMAKRSYNIEIITKEMVNNLSWKEKVVYEVVEDLAIRNHIKMPEVWVYDDEDPNAFATWASKNSSLVAVSTWLLNTMSKDEIEWVIGHEMAHILNGDMVTMTLLQWVLNTFVVFFSRIIAWIADKFFSSDEEESSGPSWIYYVVSMIMDILLWILASMIAMWFSRYREFRADEGSAKFMWKEKMINALNALKNMQELAKGDNKELAMMKISTRKRWWIMALFSSHPDLDDRIDNLRNLRM